MPTRDQPHYRDAVDPAIVGSGLPTRPLTVQQTADYCQVSPKAIYNAVERGDLRAVKIGRTLRIRPDQLHEFLHRDR